MKIGFIDFQALREARKTIKSFPPFPQTGISTAGYDARYAVRACGGRLKFTWSGALASKLECGHREL